MGYSHGKNTRVFANGYNIGQYLKSFVVAGEADTAETSTFGDSAKEYIAGLADGNGKGEGIFDGGGSAIDAVMGSAVGRGSVVVTHLPQGEGLGNRALSLAGCDTGYGIESTVSDVVTVSVEVESSHAAEAVLQAIVTGSVAGAGSAAGVDLIGAAGTQTDGYVGVLHWFGNAAGTPSSIDFFLAHSPDNVTFTVLPGTVNLVGPGSAIRLSGTGTCHRYVRPHYVVNGGGTATVAAFVGNRAFNTP